MTALPDAILKKAIQEALPEHFKLIGPSNLRDVIRFTLDGIPPEEIIAPTDPQGHHSALGDIVQIIAYAAIAAKNMLDIYIATQKEGGKAPSAEDLAREVPVNSSLPPETTKKVADSVWKQLTLF